MNIRTNQIYICSWQSVFRQYGVRSSFNNIVKMSLGTPFEGLEIKILLQYWWTLFLISEFDLLSVLVHEIGHSLGLGHSGNLDDAMAPFLVRGKTFSGLKDDDIKQIKSLYGGNVHFSLFCFRLLTFDVIYKYVKDETAVLQSIYKCKCFVPIHHHLNG